MRVDSQGLHVDLAGTNSPPRELPPIAALFVICFDIKAGYTITWKRTAQNVSLDGVEFKSLPSGLHNLESDLVYFVHPPYAGVSAFIRVPAPEADRNALMLSIGVLVPLSHGRLGRSWRHAANLQALSKTYAADTNNYTALQEYYDANQMTEPEPGVETDSPVESPSSLRYRGGYKLVFDRLGHTRTRSISDTTGLVPSGQSLCPFHPALSLREYIDMFGPLIFPLYRAALNRQRILLITSAPVQPACNFVYDISILSNIPLSVGTLLPTAPSRLRPLFSVGVPDIPFLETEAKLHSDPTDTAAGSWVACTTDGVLYVKSSLYDLVVTLPPPHARNATKRAWPKLECPAGVPVLATQRDLARYRALRRGMRWWGRRRGEDGEENDEEDEEDIEVLRGEEEVCEKLTWREIAYTSFIWWASAGEKRRDPSERPDTCDGASTTGFESEGEGEGEDEGEGEEDTVPLMSPGDGRVESTGCLETDIVAYFHRLTGRLMGGMADIIEEGDEDDVFFSLEDVDRLGLDRYSEGDVAFVKAICRRYFGREASAEVGGWGCWGLC